MTIFVSVAKMVRTIPFSAATLEDKEKAPQMTKIAVKNQRVERMAKFYLFEVLFFAEGLYQ